MPRPDPVRLAGAVLASVLALAVQAAPKPVRWVVTCPAPRAAAQLSPNPEPAPTATADLAAALPTQAAPPLQAVLPGPTMPALAPASPSRTAEPAVSAPAEVPTRPVPAEGTGDVRPETPAAVAVTQSLPAALPVSLDASRTQVAAAAPASPSAVLMPRWEVQTADLTLDKTLQRWAQQAGYRLQWDAARTLLVGAPTTFQGEFEAAVAELLGTPGIRMSDYPLEACVYANTPPLVRITRQGDQARECTAVNP